jgi:hypothetical protein
MARSRGEILEDIEYQHLGDRDPGAESDDGDDRKTGSTPTLLSKCKPGQIFRVCRGHFLADSEASSNWRRKTVDAFGFIAGDQLSEEDKQLLDAQRRPHITFNRVLTILKAVAGMQINGRNEVQYLPRNTEDTEVNEILTAASKFMADGCDAEDEESAAFQDCAVCGIGVTESRFTYDDDPAGMYVEDTFEPTEFYWDRTARKKNLRDTRRRARKRRMPLSDAMQLFPGKNRVQLDATWAETEGENSGPRSIEEKRIRDGEDSYEEFDDKNEVTLVCMEWWEREPYYRVADEATQTIVEMTEAEHTRLQGRMALLSQRLGVPVPIHSVRLVRKRYYRAWLGSEYLGHGPAPCGNRFSWSVITGEFDKKKRMWFGLEHVMHDPQKWANKFMSQIMQIMNSTAKGGILAETDAFDDEEEAEETYAQPEAITWVSTGALSGQKPKIIPKPGQGDASSYVNLLQFAVSSIKDVTGINLELLGQQDQNQPGILEHMRKQAGMTVLATLFDSLKSYMRFIGQIRLHYIQNRMSDGRLIRVVGQDYVKSVRLAKEKTTGEYDVIVDDAPTSPNQKEANWAIIQPMLAVFKDQLMASPEVLVMVLRYSPLPAPLVDAISKIITQSANDPKKQQEAEEMRQLTIQHLVADTNKLQSTAEMNLAKAGSTQATAVYDIAMARNMMEDNQLSGLKSFIEAKEAEARVNKMNADTQTAAVKTVAQIADLRHKQSGSPIDLHKAVTDRIRAHTEARKSEHDQAMDRAKTSIEHINARAGMLASVAGAHADMAKAHRDRVGAHVDARPEPAGAK